MATEHGAVDCASGNRVALSVGTLLLTWWLVAAATSDAAFDNGAMVHGIRDRLCCCCSAGRLR